MNLHHDHRPWVNKKGLLFGWVQIVGWSMEKTSRMMNDGGMAIIFTPLWSNDEKIFWQKPNLDHNQREKIDHITIIHHDAGSFFMLFIQ